MAEEIRFFEVGPRDGLQNEATIVSVEHRVELVERLVKAGVNDVEIGAFVHPKWVPQMEGTEEVAEAIEQVEGVNYWGLVPNQVGLERALGAGLEHVAVFMSATEAHNQHNLNRSLDESLKAVRATITDAKDEGLGVRAYLSTVFGCPYEGAVEFDVVLELCDQLLAMGADHISLGDTIGAGYPPQVQKGCRRAVEAFGAERVALHLHDTQGMGLANALVAYNEGVRLFDGAVGGLGGCPYAPGAAGNVASEDLLNMLHSMGADSGVSRRRLCRVSRWVEGYVDSDIQGKCCDYWRAHDQQRDEA